MVAKLKPLAENPPASFSSDARAQLWHAYALGEDRLGGERGDNARLVTAIAYYRKVLEEWTRERVPLDWAMTQNNLGIALGGVLASGRAARRGWKRPWRPFARRCKEWTRERVPLDWAMTQTNLGGALGHSASGRAARRGWRRPWPPSRGPQGADPRARAARLGHDAE